MTPAKKKNRHTPFKLFSDYNNLLGKTLSVTEMRDEYNNLSLEDKYKWIQKAMKMYPDVSGTGASRLLSDRVI